MNTSRSIKIWTLIAHGVIIVGAGHGIIFFFLLEFSVFTGIFTAAAAAILLGQLAIALSMLKKTARYKILLHFLGLLFLWISIVYFIYSNRNDDYVHFLTITAIPFVVCTVLTFIPPYIKKLLSRLG